MTDKVLIILMKTTVIPMLMKNAGSDENDDHDNDNRGPLPAPESPTARGSVVLPGRQRLALLPALRGGVGRASAH